MRHVHSHEDSPRLNVLSVRDVVVAVRRPNLGFSPTQQRPSTQMNPHRRRKTSTVSFSPIVHPWSFTPGHISRLQQSLNVIEKRSWERSHGSTLLISLASLHSDSFDQRPCLRFLASPLSPAEVLSHLRATDPQAFPDMNNDKQISGEADLAEGTNNTL